MGTEGVRVKVKRLHRNAVIPEYKTAGAAGFDLASCVGMRIWPGQTVMVPTGLAFEIPDGFEMQIRPRSGIAAKTDLICKNTLGTIDCDYRGEVFLLLHNLSASTSHTVNPGDRLCQGVLAPVTRAAFTESDTLSETARGSGGFGHTGVA